MKHDIMNCWKGAQIMQSLKRCEISTFEGQDFIYTFYEIAR
jgi:hypothetical protein